MEVADVIVEDGKIAQVGEDLEVPSGAKIIDATDKFVMPGMQNGILVKHAMIWRIWFCKNFSICKGAFLATYLVP